MSGLLPAFVVIPLIAAFILPLFGKKGKDAATVLANIITILLLGLAVFVVATEHTIGVVSAAAMLYSARYMERYTAKSKYLSLFLLMVAGMNGVVLSGDMAT